MEVAAALMALNLYLNGVNANKGSGVGAGNHVVGHYSSAHGACKQRFLVRPPCSHVR